jgi:quercetin dioxygenase-like cupin family protein
MFSKLFWAVVFVGLALQFVLAQDPTKVEPKHYKLAFENEWVQVVDVHYGPHEKSGMHDHPGGVVVVLTPGHLRFTGQDGKIKEVYAKPGESRWYPAFKHQVENLGDTSYDAVYIGIKSKPTAGKLNPGNPDLEEQPAMDAQTARIVAGYLASANR